MLRNILFFKRMNSKTDGELTTAPLIIQAIGNQSTWPVTKQMNADNARLKPVVMWTDFMNPKKIIPPSSQSAAWKWK